MFSDVASSFTDVFGGQSGKINRRLRGGEMMCMAQLRLSAPEIGGNAVVGVDIDYTEFGGEKGIVAVCMTGTVVRLKNTEILGDEKAPLLTILASSLERIKYLKQLLK